MASFLVFALVSCVTHSHVNIEREGRIVNGLPASTTDYPWIVSLQWTQDGIEGRNVACTGSLIRATYPALMLTAAHCCGAKMLVDSGYKYYGDIGREYPYKEQSGDNYISLRAFFWYNFKAYSNQQRGNTINALTDYDACIVVLDGNVSNIDPVTLYNSSNDQHSTKCCTEDQVVRAIGYGFIDDNRTETDVLRYLDMKYMSDLTNCSEEIIDCIADKDDSVMWDDIVPSDGSTICTQMDDGCICQGDSGGPLVYIDANNGDILQIGVASQSCCIKGVPNMFASVGFFYQGIQSIFSDQQWINYLPTTTSTTSATTDDDIGAVDRLNGMYGFIVVSFVLYHM